MRAASLAFVLLGLAFGLSVPLVMAHLDRTGELPMTFGFRSLSGPLEQLGREAFKALAWSFVASFVAVCAADVVAGIGLWRGRRWGVRLGLVTSPQTFELGLGFALPLVLVGVPIRVALVLAGRRALADAGR